MGRDLVKRAEAAGCPVLVLAADLQGGPTARRRRADSAATRGNAVAVTHRVHSVEPGQRQRHRRPKPMFAGLDISAVSAPQPLDMNWDIIKRLRDTTSMKILVKGIVTNEDAAVAVEHGVDGAIVSNGGGRGARYSSPRTADDHTDRDRQSE